MGEGVTDRVAQTEDRLVPSVGQDGFLGHPYYFLNATPLSCLFSENSSPMCNTHIRPLCKHIKDMLM